jgi:hypothetical protein
MLRQARRTAVTRLGANRLDIARDILRSMLDDPDYGEWARETLARIGE